MAQQSYQKSLAEYGRGLVGGLLFSLPLLYTMEVWWQGLVVHPTQLLLYLAGTFILLLAYNRYAGLREDTGWKEIFIDSVEEMGLGFVLSFFILWLFGQINFHTSPPEDILSKTTVEAMTVAIGISVGTAQLGSGGEDNDEKGFSSDKNNKEKSYTDELIEHVSMAVCGGILVGSNVGPTMEIVEIALMASQMQILLIALFSIVLSISILYFMDFRNAQEFGRHNKLYAILYAAGVNYSIALITSTFMLWFFGRFDDNSFFVCLNIIVVLGLATTIGASAGRLLLK